MSGPLEIGKQVKVNENLVLYHTFERETRSWIKQVPKRGPNQRIFKLWLDFNLEVLAQANNTRLIAKAS